MSFDAKGWPELRTKPHLTDRPVLLGALEALAERVRSGDLDAKEMWWLRGMIENDLELMRRWREERT